MSDLILASSSRYRAELLGRLGLAFRAVAPDVDESARAGESPRELVARLSELKARTIANDLASGLVIGSDQVAELDGRILGKPGTAERACEQLALLSGRSVYFHTGLCLVDAGTQAAQITVVDTRVRFRALSADEIDDYVAREQPLDCAGAFKSEGLGIALFDAIEGDDPNALIGLPLIALCGMLRNAGMHVLGGTASAR